MNNQGDRERIAVLENDMKTMKSDVRDVKGDVKSVQWTVGIGVGIIITINAIAILWVAVYHH